jgi:hypothetical protein
VRRLSAAGLFPFFWGSPRARRKSFWMGPYTSQLSSDIFPAALPRSVQLKFRGHCFCAWLFSKSYDTSALTLTAALGKCCRLLIILNEKECALHALRPLSCLGRHSNTYERGPQALVAFSRRNYIRTLFASLFLAFFPYLLILHLLKWIKIDGARSEN